MVMTIVVERGLSRSLTHPLKDTRENECAHSYGDADLDGDHDEYFKMNIFRCIKIVETFYYHQYLSMMLGDAMAVSLIMCEFCKINWNEVSSYYADQASVLRGEPQVILFIAYHSVVATMRSIVLC